MLLPGVEKMLGVAFALGLAPVETGANPSEVSHCGQRQESATRHLTRHLTRDRFAPAPVINQEHRSLKPQ